MIEPERERFWRSLPKAEKIESVRRLIEAGMNGKQIADYFGVSSSAIYKFCEYMAIPISKMKRD